jgi:hypothetical protein
MTTPTTQAELLTLVAQRYPHLDVSVQARLADSALRIMAEPQWVRLHITPMRAVKLASLRSKKRKSF